MHGGVFYAYSDFEHLVGSLMEGQTRPRLMAVLFAQEGHEITEKVLKPSFNYFNKRSREHLHIILAGWELQYKDYKFSHDDFVKAVEIFEANSTFKYKGGTVLLLFGADVGPSHVIEYRDDEKNYTTVSSVDLSSVMQIEMDVLGAKRLVDSARVVLENVIAFARKYEGADPVRAYGAQEMRRGLADGIVEGLLDLLPKAAQEKINYVRQHFVKDISNDKHKVQIKVISKAEVTRDMFPVDRQKRLLRYQEREALLPKQVIEAGGNYTGSGEEAKRSTPRLGDGE
jgi:hypothetical protein